MGLRYRKSINLGGGFRVNLSKSGVGYSWGVPGARFTKTATGGNRATLSIPGTGISYVEESGGSRNRPAQPRQAQPDHGESIHIHSVENADVSAYSSEQYADFLQAATSFLSGNIALTWTSMLLLLAALFSFVIGGNGFIISGISAIASVVFLIIRSSWIASKRINAEYDMDEFGERRVALINSLIENLQNNNEILQVTDFYQSTEAKRNAGAKETVSTIGVKINIKSPPFLHTNVQCYHIQLKKESLYVLPDKLLVVAGSKVGAIDWGDLEISTGTISYVVKTAPKDATIIEETWQYIKNDGTRDKRFNNNRKHYICRYGKLEFKSEQGFNTLLYVSNNQTAEEFKRLLAAEKAAER